MRLRLTIPLLVVALAGSLATGSAGRADAGPADLPVLQLFLRHYVVWADDCSTSLGSWSALHGLGNPAKDVELTRLAGTESELVLAWLSDPTPRTHDLTITLVTSIGEPLATWRLLRVVPLDWSIQGLDAQHPHLSLETLEVSYEALTRTVPCWG
jgi:hypothetical protein